MRVSHPKDLDVAQRISAGDEGAAEDLFRNLSGEMFGFVRKMLGGDPALAEDVLQEAMVGILRSMNKFDGRVRLRSWMYRILRNKIVDAQRKRGREPVFSVGDPEGDRYDAHGSWQKGVTIQPWNENAEVLDVVRRCMELLPHNQREALHLLAVQGIPAQEVATILEMNYNNLRQTLHRGRQSVRRCADQALGNLPEEGQA